MASEVVNEEVCAAKNKKNCNNSKDPLGSVEGRVTKLEVVIAKVQSLVEDASRGIEELQEQVQGTLNNIVDDLSKRDDVLEALIIAMCTEINKLRVELNTTRTRGVGGFAANHDPRTDILK